MDPSEFNKRVDERVAEMREQIETNKQLMAFCVAHGLPQELFHFVAWQPRNSVGGIPKTPQVEIQLRGTCELTFAHLELLATLFGSRKINIALTEAEGDLSELTPGAPC